MKKIILGIWFCVLSLNASAQFAARMQVKEPIEGICDEKEVIALFPMLDGQTEAIRPLSDKKILKRLNKEVQYIKDHPTFVGEGMISLIINCKGEVVKCEMDNNTKSPELDKQIEAIFNSLGEWKAGKFHGKEVDSVLLYSFKIKKGKITFK